jgi:apolipoprotein N-acyltransferase
MQLPLSRIHQLIAVLSFVLISWLAWPAGGFAPLLFVAWIPLLFLEESFTVARREGLKVRFFPIVYLAFFLFNLATTWWIYFASLFGMLGAVMANALLMTFVFFLFHHIKLITGRIAGYVFLVCAWTAFEFLHLDWDLTWTWLNLGNGFAAYPDLVQWYEFTGTGGGTIWILTVNILLFSYLLQPSKKAAAITGAFILLPILISHLLLSNYKEKIDPVEVVVIQPNIDPYNEKFGGMSYEEQLNRMLQLAASKVTANTAVCFLPETALPEGIWEEQIQNHPDILRLKKFAAAYPDLNIICGAATYRFYRGNDFPSTARKFGRTEDHYDAFNTALHITKDSVVAIYHKSKLVPGVEKMPYPALFGYLDQFAIDLGGIAGSLGMQDSSEVFTGRNFVAAPVICYESIYGEYVGSYILRGANMISIITNDGWWSDTPGYRQHLQYARLRAIEHRRSIARSANTGISCFIDQTGKIHQPTQWWEPDAVRAEINLNSELTFYTRHGDYPGRIALIIGTLLLATAFFKSRFKSVGKAGV